jgi:energy-coupling factor transporter ATP-binding protein EcfA2
MIFLISGKQGSGKSTLTNNLIGRLKATSFEPMSIKFADPLYEMHRRVLNVMAEYGIAVPVKDGKLLQLLGTEWGRAVHGDNVWVNLAKKRIETFMDGPSRERRVAIIDDCRFKNELFGFPEAFKIRLLCDRDARKARADAWRDSETHQSEVDLDEVDQRHWDLVIDTAQNSATEVAELVLRASLKA